MRLLAASLFLLLSLGGCLDSVLDDEAGLSAMEARKVADRSARAWDGGAELVLVQGGEARNESLDGEAPRERFADGRAQAFSFYYRAPEQEDAWNVTVGGDGGILYEGTERLDADPVTGWRIDSTRMMQVLRQEAEGFADRVDGGQTEGLFYALGNDFDDLGANDTVWVVLEGAGELYIHVVHAGNGTLLHSEPFTFELDLEGVERGSFDGSLTALAPAATHLFSLDEDHDFLDVGISADAFAPGSRVNLNVTAPDGTSTEEVLVPALPGDDHAFRLEPAPAGGWSIALALEGAALDYTVSYCSSGFGFSFGTPFEPTCPQVDA